MSNDQQKALSIKEAAELLGVSYSTVYAHVRELGFFRVGAAWRVWPENLKQLSSYNQRRPARTDEGANDSWLSESAKAATSGTLTSVSRAAADLDKLLAPRTERRRKNSTTK
ncbi:helix-turn-helix domain-containing protein [Burkholderia multivorans]|nr:helix-turn-helix domain-containing protein [Burkholderia multivorans]